MPTNDPNNGSNGNSSDVLSSLLNSHNAATNTEIQLLRSIDSTLKDILKNGSGMSQSNAMNRLPGVGGQHFGRMGVGNTFGARKSAGGFMDEFEEAFKREIMSALVGSDFKSKISGIMEDFAKDMGVSVQDIPKMLGKGLAQKVAGTTVGKNLSGRVKGLANSALGGFQTRYAQGRDTRLNSHPNERLRTEGANFRRQWEQSQSNARAGSPNKSNLAGAINTQNLIVYAQQVTIAKVKDLPTPNTGGEDENGAGEGKSELDMLKDFLSDKVDADALSSLSDDALSSIMSKAKAGDLASLTSELGTAFGGANAAGLAEGITGLATGAGSAGPALAGLASAAAPLLPILAGIAVVGAAIYVGLKLLGPAIEGTKELIEKSVDSAKRYEKSREEMIKNEKERIAADVKVMIEEPFNILSKAAEEMYNIWDSNLRMINATQGYNKDDLQSLVGSFSQRLRDEGLTKVVSAGSITENLTRVLESGLSGTVAEEFAYLATKLNAAIPTQDFFSYAGTYSSIAANAIKNGASQSEAIAEANEQLEGFASNLLYASREVAGGFTTGLKDAEHLFTQSVQIAQASRTGNASQISAVMTAVSAITGAIAPDLATSMTDAIYKAATGGNSSEIVALRSLAGINASNTEFLKKVAQEPQVVFANLFNALAEKQQMSADAYMEVAEGLSSVFGVSADAFARVDFAYLAQAIASMDSSSGALLDNIDLLASGETTTNAEQLKMQQINEYMLEEGLAYVLDNEAARSIQENMWAEQRAQKIMEAEYGVNLHGAALDFLEGIRKTIDNIVTFLNPIGFLGKIASGIANLVGTAAEAVAQDADVRQLLELGKVGNGNAESLRQLTTRGVDLDVTDSIQSLMGGVSAYETASSMRKAAVNFYTPHNAMFDLATGKYTGGPGGAYHLAATAASSIGRSNASSLYNWGTISKSTANLHSGVGGQEVLGMSLLRAEAAQQSSKSAASRSGKSAIETFLGSMESFLEEHKGDDNISYEDWLATSTRFGIADTDTAFSEAGLTNESLRGQFEAYQTKQGIEEKKERERKEEQFWIDTVDNLVTANTWLETIYNKHVEFFDAFIAFAGEKGMFDTYFTKYQDTFDDYLAKWTDYFIKHTAYKEAVGYNSSSWNAVKSAENKESRDAVYKLAEALTKNSVDLLDPTVQTNVLLAEILQIVNAIMQQGNNASSSTSLPESIAGMALGVVNV